MVNHVVLVGNLGSDPEVRTFGDQQKVTRLSLATHEIVRKRSGERERQTEWHQVVAWAALGERAARHLRKGRNVLVEGRLQTRVWADARGNKHITAEVRADRILFLGRGRVGNRSTSDDDRQEEGERPRGAAAPLRASTAAMATARVCMGAPSASHSTQAEVPGRPAGAP